MNRIVDLAIAIALACFFPLVVFAQASVLPKWEVGLGVGPFMYQGDLAPSALGSWKTIRPACGDTLAGLPRLVETCEAHGIGLRIETILPL